QRGLGIVANPAWEPDRRLDDDVRSARVRSAQQATGQQTEARLTHGPAMLVDRGQGSLRDEHGEETGALLRCGVDRLPQDRSRKGHRPAVGAGVARLAFVRGACGLRLPGDAESRHPTLHPALHSLPHAATRRPGPPVLKYSASVTASTGPMQTPASSDTRTRA